MKVLKSDLARRLFKEGKIAIPLHEGAKVQDGSRTYIVRYVPKAR
jgi:hypothetical protein